MPAYLDLAGFRDLTIVPSDVIDRAEARSPGWIAAQLEAESSWIDARLAKRYAVPFTAPYPSIVKRWLARIVSATLYDKHGVDPTDQQAQRYYDGETAAKAEIKEAADAVDGLLELPLRADTSATGVSRGRPRSYSEASPYVSRDRQWERGAREDAQRGGTRRG